VCPSPDTTAWGTVGSSWLAESGESEDRVRSAGFNHLAERQALKRVRKRTSPLPVAILRSGAQLQSALRLYEHYTACWRGGRRRPNWNRRLKTAYRRNSDSGARPLCPVGGNRRIQVRNQRVGIVDVAGEAEVDQHVLTMMLFGALDGSLAAVMHKDLLGSRNDEQRLTNRCGVRDTVKIFHSVIPSLAHNGAGWRAIPPNARSSSTCASMVGHA